MVAHWADDEGAGLAVYSGGELATALAADVDPSRIVLHGNAKTVGELQHAAAAGVGRMVIESSSEIALLAGWMRHRQQVLLRVAPDLTGGHRTGVREQKFGFTLDDGQIFTAGKRVLGQPWLDLIGLHCQIGSQLRDAGLYGEAVRQMIAAMAQIRDRHQVVLSELNLGGGHAVPSVSGDPELSLGSLGGVIDAALRSVCAEYDFPRPRIVIEPGRAIAARAGITLFRVIAVKRLPGGQTFAAVDGGVYDNPRETLNGAKYTVALANRHLPSATAPVTVVGRHCEAGDEIAHNVELPADIHPGDLLAVACTGAYHHSMGSSCNLEGRPPLIAVAGGRARELVRRETVADLMARDLGWAGRDGGRPGTSGK